MQPGVKPKTRYAKVTLEVIAKINEGDDTGIYQEDPGVLLECLTSADEGDLSITLLPPGFDPEKHLSAERRKHVADWTWEPEPLSDEEVERAVNLATSKVPLPEPQLSEALPEPEGDESPTDLYSKATG